MNIAGIILAAGESKRMGKPKALLEFQDKQTLLAGQAALLTNAGCNPIVVVIGYEPEEVMRAHPELNVSWCVNRDWEQGQFSSLQAGVAHVLHHDIKGVFLLPVDVAGVKPSTLAALSEAVGGKPQPYAIVPTFKGKGGHPVYISLDFCRKIIKTDISDRDARLDVILRQAAGTVYLPVDDANVIRNINTPDEWRCILGDN